MKTIITKTELLNKATTFLLKIQELPKTEKLQKQVINYIDYLNDDSDNLKSVIDYLIGDKMTGKMEGLQNLSTSCKCNDFCKSYQKIDNCICQSCYADNQLNMYKPQNLKLEFASLVLYYTEINTSDFPLMNVLFFRLEAFGDLFTTLQVKNYFTFAKKNSDTNFTLWTKNPFIITAAINDYNISVPKNVKIIYSEKQIDKTFLKSDIENLRIKYPFIWKVFAVYSNENTRQAAINNFGYFECQKSCNNCRFCYRHLNNDIFIIAELLK